MPQMFILTLRNFGNNSYRRILEALLLRDSCFVAMLVLVQESCFVVMLVLVQRCPLLKSELFTPTHFDVTLDNLSVNMLLQRSFIRLFVISS